MKSKIFKFTHTFQAIKIRFTFQEKIWRYCHSNNVCTKALLFPSITCEFSLKFSIFLKLIKRKGIQLVKLRFATRKSFLWNRTFKFVETSILPIFFMHLHYGFFQILYFFCSYSNITIFNSVTNI